MMPRRVDGDEVKVVRRRRLQRRLQRGRSRTGDGARWESFVDPRVVR